MKLFLHPEEERKKERKNEKRLIALSLFPDLRLRAVLLGPVLRGLGLAVLVGLRLEAGVQLHHALPAPLPDHRPGGARSSGEEIGSEPHLVRRLLRDQRRQHREAVRGLREPEMPAGADLRGRQRRLRRLQDVRDGRQGLERHQRHQRRGRGRGRLRQGRRGVGFLGGWFCWAVKKNEKDRQKTVQRFLEQTNEQKNEREKERRKNPR